MIINTEINQRFSREMHSIAIEIVGFQWQAAVGNNSRRRWSSSNTRRLHSWRSTCSASQALFCARFYANRKYTFVFVLVFSQTNLKIQHRVVRRALSSEVPSLIPTASTTSTTTSTSTTSTSTTAVSSAASVSTTSTSTSTTASAVQIRRAAADRYPLPNVKPKKKYCQLFHSFIT